MNMKIGLVLILTLDLLKTTPRIYPMNKTVTPQIVTPKKVTKRTRKITKSFIKIYQQECTPLSALYRATQEEDLSGIQKQLEKCPKEINQACIFGNTPAYIAAEEGYCTILKKLISNGAQVNAKNDFGEYPIHAACYNNDLAIIKILTESNADLHVTNFEGPNVLHIASCLGNIDIVLFLITKDGLINSTNGYGETCLHIAVANHKKAIIEVLLKHQIALEARDNRGQTALHIATKNGDVQTVKLLVEHGADIYARDFFGLGRMALEIALENRDFETAFYLNFVSNFYATLLEKISFETFANYYLTETRNRFNDTKNLLQMDKKGDFTKKFNKIKI